jgi:hypothetical protein
MRRLLKPSCVPTAIGAILLLFVCFCLVWNGTVGELLPRGRIRSSQFVAGLVQKQAPEFSVRSLVTGQYQRWVSGNIGTLSPFFVSAVRWKNQLYYTLLGMSGTEQVIVGRDRELLEMP